MEVIKTMQPGAAGTKKFVEHYGSKLVTVRYRQDKQNNRQLTTVEIIVDERMPSIVNQYQRSCKSQPSTWLAVKVAYDETDLRQKVKSIGGRWDVNQKVWWLAQDDVNALGLIERVVDKNS